MDFKIVVSESTGELSRKRIADYNYCKIIIYDSGIVLFTGSIHKMYNSLHDIKAPNYDKSKIYSGFNGNQFTIDQIFQVRDHLEELFDCTANQMLFQNIELGINTTPSFTPKLYLKGLLYHRNKQFEYRYENNLAQAPHQRYFLKIYNKSRQYNMSMNVLRIELKIIKTEELKTIGLKTFSDVNESTLSKAKEMLLKRFDEVVHYDYTISRKKLTYLEKNAIKNYSNPRYWINDLNPKYRDRHKKRLQKITAKYSKNLHLKLREEIMKKCVIINRLSENPKCVIINSSSIGLNITHYTF
ncbi:hypothetical protein GTQ40_15735 [Flavobacteriaceae bacterium R38]|nr:hypothetical protein [Flavobacteriaceae bacterium R38]